MTFIDVVNPCVETLIFSARKIHFSFLVTHVSIISSDMYPPLMRRVLPFTECSATQALRPDQISVYCLDPLHFRCLIETGLCRFDHWAITLSLKDGCFQAYFMVVFKNKWLSLFHLVKTNKKIFFISPNTVLQRLLEFRDLYFGSGLFPFW